MVGSYATLYEHYMKIGIREYIDLVLSYVMHVEGLVREKSFGSHFGCKFAHNFLCYHKDPQE